MGFDAIAQYRQHQVFKDYYTARAIGNERISQRIYVGVGKHFINGSAKLHYIGPDSSGTRQIDTNIDTKVRAKHSFVVYGGTFFPIALISDQSIIAFSVEFLGSYNDLTLDSVVFRPGEIYKKSESIVMLGVPLSIDFKTGGDVSLSKAQRGMFGIGGGVLAGGTSSYVDQTAQAPFKFIPFIKAEVGYFAGIAFKLRAVAYFGDANFIDRVTGNIYGNDQLFTTVKSGYGFQVSLNILPFSYGWRTEEWY